MNTRSDSRVCRGTALVIAVFCLMVFTLSMGEFNLTWMLHTPLTRTLPVGLADSYASARIATAIARRTAHGSR